MAQHGADGVQTPGRSTRGLGPSQASCAPSLGKRSGAGCDGDAAASHLEPVRAGIRARILTRSCEPCPNYPPIVLCFTIQPAGTARNPTHGTSCHSPKGLLGGQQWRAWLEYRLPMTPWDARPRVQHICHSSNPSRWTAHLNAESPVNWSFAALSPLVSGTAVAIEGRSLF